MSKADTNTYKIESVDNGLGEVQIADEVISVIAGIAAMEVEGVSSMAGTTTSELVGFLGYKSLSKGVKLEIIEDVASISLTINVKFGRNIQATTRQVQEKVKAAIENMVGMKVADVNIAVVGVDMDSDKK